MSLRILVGDLLLGTTLFLMPTFMAVAQPNASQHKLEVGLKCGADFSKFRGNMGLLVSEREVRRHQLGVTGGAFLSYKLHAVFAIQIEALITVKGSKWQAVDSTYKQTLTYLQFPLLVKAGLRARSLRPSVYAGPVFGVLLRARHQLTGFGPETPTPNPHDFEADDKALFNDTEIGLLAGLSLEFPLGHRSLIVDGRMDIGLSALRKQPPPPRIRYLDMKTNTVSITLGYTL